jgi:hypothetical protein
MKSKKQPQGYILNPQIVREIDDMIKTAPRSRCYMSEDGVLFLSVDDLIQELKAFSKVSNDMEILIVGIETSKYLAEMEYRKLKEKK